MLFTPVPNTPMFEMYRDYIEEKGFDLQHLNGKLLPFLDYNQRTYQGLSYRDYFALEGLMWRLNAKVRSESFDIGGEGHVASAFRKVLLNTVLK
jgi:hypothetical protein